MEKLLSIIVPIYGVELYIEEFAESLLRQVNDDIECIFINDGTKDNSMIILESIKNKYNTNCIIINQKNKGLSAARNSGLKVATGKYITFLDSDDIVLDNYINSITSIIKENNDIGIIHFNAKVKKDKKNITINLVDKTLKSSINSNTMINIFKKNIWFSWLRVFRADILHGFNFPDGYVMEDIISIPFIYKENTIIYELFEDLLIYRIREGSLSNSKNYKYNESIEYGIKLFRGSRNIEHMKYVYIHLIDILYKFNLENGYNSVLKFQEKFNDDFNYINTTVTHNSWKERIKWSNPKIFYIYKTRFFLKKIRSH